MKITSLRIPSFAWLLAVFLLLSTSCNKESEKYAFEGTVYDKNSNPVVDARIQIFKSPQDWLTGHNIIVSMVSNLRGDFKSEKKYEAGDYYMFIEKYDTSNWDFREVERGIYPKINLPTDGVIKETIEPNSMSLLANTSWILTNILTEFTQPNHTAVEWHSQWNNTNNCKKDNMLYFGKDLTLRISEGETVCSGKERNILAKFVPPLIFSGMSCDDLMHTSQKVKEFEYSGWAEMTQLNAKMYLACDQSLGQLYIIHNVDNDKVKVLEVYKRK